MIIVRVELWSAVNGEKTELARMIIDNIGGTAQRGDYRCRTLRGRSAEALNAAMTRLNKGQGGAITREGKVVGHARLAEHVWNLVAKALSGMGYGQNGGNKLMHIDEADLPF